MSSLVRLLLADLCLLRLRPRTDRWPRCAALGPPTARTWQTCCGRSSSTGPGAPRAAGASGGARQAGWQGCLKLVMAFMAVLRCKAV